MAEHGNELLDGCKILEKKYKEFLRLNAKALPYKIKPSWLINFYPDPRGYDGVKWVHTIAIPTYPEPARDYVRFAKIAILRVEKLTEENMESIKDLGMTSKTRAIAGADFNAVKDTDIAVIADSFGKGSNRKFEFSIRRRSPDGHRGAMTFSIRQGPEFIEKSIMGILGRWLKKRAEGLQERAKKELYGNLQICNQFMQDLGEYLEKESMRIVIPIQEKKKGRTGSGIWKTEEERRIEESNRKYLEIMERNKRLGKVGR